MVNAIATLKGLLGKDGDVGVKNALYLYAPNLLEALRDDEEELEHDEQPEVLRAKRGLPTSYRPRASASKPEVPKESNRASVEKAVDKSPVEKVEASTKTSPSSVAAEPEEKPINSASHRAAHARLTRKMQSLDTAQFPQMAKLWNGGRKDWC